MIDDNQLGFFPLFRQPWRIFKRRQSDHFNIRRELNADQIFAVFKSVGADFRDAVRKLSNTKILHISERIVSDIRNAVIDFNLLNLRLDRSPRYFDVTGKILHSAFAVDIQHAVRKCPKDGIVLFAAGAARCRSFDVHRFCADFRCSRNFTGYS